jgi:nucleotide-binding universal stress UspA family protein
MSTFHRIVCGTDFSATSEEALDVATALSEDTGAEVHLVHVVPDPLTQPWMVEGAGIDFGDLRRTALEDADRTLQRLVESRGLKGRVKPVILMGTAAPEIEQYVVDHEADLIVVGSHGHGVVRRFLLGSVAERVFKTSTCPVLVVPHRTLARIPARATQPAELATTN